MRVIAGTARRLLLKTLPGMDTRPTTDQIKETLFNMINFDLPGCRFLDLFGGSGAIGIEALSRGAEYAVFADNNPKAAAVIRENLEHTHLDDRAQVYAGDGLFVLRKMEISEKQPFDIIFLDPPYDKGLEDNVLAALKNSSLIDEDSVIIIECRIETDISRYTDLGYTLVKAKEYKSNKHVFLKRSVS